MSSHPIRFRERTSDDQPSMGSTVKSAGVSYDPKSRASIQQFLNHPKIQKELIRNHATGDLYYLDRENSSFILIENGDYSKAKSIKVTNLGEDGTWEKIHPSELQQRARIYMLAKSSIEAGIKKINKDRGTNKLNFKSVVIDPKHMHVRGYVSPDITDTTTVKTGSLIDIDKGIWQKIENIVTAKDKEHDRPVHEAKGENKNEPPSQKQESPKDEI
jgi:hypothetical protein